MKRGGGLRAATRERSRCAPQACHLHDLSMCARQAGRGQGGATRSTVPECAYTARQHKQPARCD